MALCNTLLWIFLELLFLGSTDAWFGDRCCEQAVDDRCRSACLKSNSREEMLGDCRQDYEETYYSCIYRHESRRKCCAKRSGLSRFCRHRCDLSFRSDSGPSQKDISTLASSCDVTMTQCVRNYTESVRAKSIESVKCCHQATNQQCQESCFRIIRNEMNDGNVIRELRKTCGEIVPHEPMWRCFLAEPTPESRSGPFVTELQCCSRCISHSCNQLCLKIHANPWPEPSLWSQFERQCVQNQEEMELHQCLEEVRAPCTMGCRNLSFCTNFNNRATTLFRGCSAQADVMARDHFKTWSSGIITLPTIDIPVKNIYQCEPESWKAVACTLQVKPCHSKIGKTIFCKDDCVSLLNKCADKSRFQSSMTVEKLCEILSPSHLQEGCVQLSTYKKPTASIQIKSDVTQPCNPNPCGEGDVCVINRRKCRSCPAHRCLPGCKLGHGSDFAVEQGALVRVPDPLRGYGCFKSCICSTLGSLRPCTNLPCTDEQLNCKMAGQMREHATNFFVECNFCTCFAGEVTCTKRQCSEATEQKQVYTGLPCNCPVSYYPVCGSNGRTYPSSCIASCLGQTHDSYKQGSCLNENPCIFDPCEEDERCVHTPRTCLTDFNHCKQFECIPRYRKCLRLLKSALSLQEGNAYNHHSHHSDQKVILSSSFFFSSISLLLNGSGVCDKNNRKFGNICKLTRSKHRTLAYAETCEATCKNSQPVCGYDQTSYSSTCLAKSNGVLVDYFSACKIHKMHGFKNVDKHSSSQCTDVICPTLSTPGCKTVVPPGSCCPLCGGLLRVLASQNHLDAVKSSSWTGPVTIRDVVWTLRQHLHVAECQLYGHLTIEGDISLLIVSTLKKPTLVQQEACSKETERLFKLINSRSPTISSYLILSPFTSATLVKASDSGVNRLIPFNCFALVLLYVIGFCVT